MEPLALGAAPDGASLAAARTDDLVAPLRAALAQRRAELVQAVDEEVLQYACAAMQELEAAAVGEAAGGALDVAMDRLSTVIDKLRVIVDEQAASDRRVASEAEVRVNEVVADIVAARPSQRELDAGLYGRRWSDAVPEGHRQHLRSAARA